MLYDQKWDKQIKLLESWRQALLDAADYLDKHGWCQHMRYHKDGRTCIMGALDRVTSNRDRDYHDAEVALFDHIGGLATSWNDAPGRTQAEAVNILRECASKVPKL